MIHTDLWNEARKLNLGKDFLDGLDTLLTKLESENKQLIIGGVTPRFLFDKGLKYYKELAEESGNELNIDTATMIAKDYVKHVNHFLKSNVV